MDYEITPHVGIGTVKLGMSREEVKEALGAENYNGSHRELDYYFDNSFQIEYADNKADFIGVSYNKKYFVKYKGINVFNTRAEELFELISSSEDQKHEYNPYRYIFPKQIVTLWEADEQYDKTGQESRPIWGQIGIGTPSYLHAAS